jgi:uncharacterized protein YaiL (DUF2058 family)
MSDSLKDQLLSLGLKPKKTSPESNQPSKSRHKPAKREQGSGDMSLDQAYRIRNQQERQQKEQAIARKREEDRLRREINQKIKALVKAHAIRDETADTKRNFLYKGRIRSVLTTIDQLRDINAGKLGVVYLSGNYHLLPSDKIAEVQGFSPDHVPDLAGAESEGEEEFPVPDDLTW